MKLIASFVALVLSASAGYSVTFNIGLDAVKDSSNQLVPTSTLALIVVDTTGNGFSTGLAGTGALAVGAFFNGTDDYIAWRGDFNGGDVGAFFDSAIFNIGTASIPNNSNFAVVWLPGLTTASFNLVNGASYGEFTTTDATEFGSTSAWNTGANNGATFNLNAYTTTNTGVIADNGTYPSRLPNSTLTASLTAISAIPEPGSYATAFGALALGFTCWRRKKPAPGRS